MKLMGGFVGGKWNSEDKSVEVEYGWAVIQEDDKKSKCSIF